MEQKIGPVSDTNVWTDVYELIMWSCSHSLYVQMEIAVGNSVDITVVTNILFSYTVNFGDGSEELVRKPNETTSSNTYTLEGEYYITGEGDRCVLLLHHIKITFDITDKWKVWFHSFNFHLSVHDEWSGVKDMLRVVVTSSKNAIGFECPELVATGETFACTFTLLRTSSSSFSVTLDETQEHKDYTLPGQFICCLLLSCHTAIL